MEASRILDPCQNIKGRHIVMAGFDQSADIQAQDDEQPTRIGGLPLYVPERHASGAPFCASTWGVC